MRLDYDFDYEKYIQDEEALKRAQSLTRELIQIFRNSGVQPSENVVLTACALYECKLAHKVLPDILHDTKIGQDGLLWYIQGALNAYAWEGIRKLYNEYTKEEFALCVLTVDPFQWFDYPVTRLCLPKSMIRLVERILNVDEKDQVCELLGGFDGFITDVALKYPDTECFSIHDNANYQEIVSRRSKLMGIQMHTDWYPDVFEMPSSAADFTGFDKVLCYTRGYSTDEYSENTPYIEKIKKEIPGFHSRRKTDWLNMLFLEELLKENGKALAIVFSISMRNHLDRALREYAVEHGYVEAIVQLPIFHRSLFQCCAVVISRGNESVRMVDASRHQRKIRYTYTMAEDDIQSILQDMNNDGAYSRLVSKDEIQQNQYDLTPKLYQRKNLNLSNPVPFDSVIKKITRGTAFKASELNDLTTDEKTNFRFLQLKDIQDGLISQDLPYLKEISPKQEKYCLTHHCLVLAKNGYPFKTAVATVREEEKILASGNLYIIQLDEEKVNPYYLLAYFNSKQGDETLKDLQAGSVIPMISVDRLKKMVIPLPDLEVQNEIADRYVAQQKNVVQLKRKLDIAVKRLSEVFDQ